MVTPSPAMDVSETGRPDMKKAHPKGWAFTWSGLTSVAQAGAELRIR